MWELFTSIMAIVQLIFLVLSVWRVSARMKGGSLFDFEGETLDWICVVGGIVNVAVIIYRLNGWVY